MYERFDAPRHRKVRYQYSPFFFEGYINAPSFHETEPNVTVHSGELAILRCTIENLGPKTVSLCSRLLLNDRGQVSSASLWGTQLANPFLSSNDFHVKDALKRSK